MKSRFFAVIAFVFLVPVFGLMISCGTVQPKTPAQTVYQIKSEYNIALQGAVDYKNLPACGTGVVLCSDPGIVKTLQSADKTASLALDQAEAIVRAPASTQSDFAKATAIAQAALNALTAIEAQLKTK